MKIIDESMMTNDKRMSKYNDYLKNHIINVKRTFSDILYEVISTETDLTAEEIANIQNQINQHDKSKYSDEEYYAYLDWFYPVNGQPLNRSEFDLAWCHHQHVNKHHYQYWILTRDSGEQIPLDMDIPSIIELLCDWHSFSKDDPKSTAYAWYQDNKDKMVLSDNTRKTIEFYIQYLKKPLN